MIKKLNRFKQQLFHAFLRHEGSLGRCTGNARPFLRPGGVRAVLLLALGLLAWAPNSFASGIDWENSIMMVEFDPENTEVPAFSCFGYSTDRLTTSGSGGTLLTACDSYSGTYTHCVWEYLSELGYDDENTEPEITNCFQQAGDYQVSSYLFDYAENLSGPDTSVFTIKAGSPDDTQSVITADAACSDLTLIANGVDSCNVELDVRDEFGNPVTQLDGQTVELTSDANFVVDANSGDYDFLTGTRIDGQVIPPSSSTGISLPLSSGADDVTNTFAVSAWAPSIRQVGVYLGKNEAFNFPFQFEMPTVDENGNLDLGNTVTFEYGQYTIPLGFQPWATTTFEVLSSPPEFLLDVEGQLKVIRNLLLPTSGGPNNQVEVFIETILPPDLYFEGLPINPIPFVTSVQERILNITLRLSDPTGVVTGDASFAGDTRYQINDGGTRDIRYPSGALGAGFGADCAIADDCDGTTIYLGSIGASIEGKIIGDKDKGVVQDYNAVRLGDIESVEDIREEVFTQAFQVTRGIEPQTQTGTQALTFATSWFASTDVALVEDADVKLGSSGSTLTLPTGANTLVIRNGNLIIEGDYEYGDSLDSFGIIMINDEVEETPATGNIFVKDDVIEMAGTIFAEGSLFTIPNALIITNDGDASVSDVSNGHVAANETQLLFTGTLLTHNTLGGGILVDLDTNYFTPWGDTVGTSDPERIEAEKYDLNFMRSYQPLYDTATPPNQTNTTDCYQPDPVGAPGVCDSNINAMIIRYDGRAVEIPPPGFDGASFFGR